MTDYQIWLTNNNCKHGHCPEECENPQPFLYEDILICGMCALKYKIINCMLPCRPDTCIE